MTRRRWLFWLLAVVVIWTRPAAAQQQQVLLWGADAKSDAPYAFVDPADQQKLVGFEKEIIDAISAPCAERLVVGGFQFPSAKAAISSSVQT